MDSTHRSLMPSCPFYRFPYIARFEIYTTFFSPSTNTQQTNVVNDVHSPVNFTCVDSCSPTITVPEDQCCSGLTVSPTTFPTFSPPPPELPIELLGQGETKRTCVETGRLAQPTYPTHSSSLAICVQASFAGLRSLSRAGSYPMLPLSITTGRRVPRPSLMTVRSSKGTHPRHAMRCVHHTCFGGRETDHVEGHLFMRVRAFRHGPTATLSFSLFLSLPPSPTEGLRCPPGAIA